MNNDEQLKVQAFLDGELSARESKEVAARLAQDQEATLLLAELRNTRQALAGFENGIRLPESREFFWSKIERDINREERSKVEPKRVPLVARLQKFLLPATGAVALLVILLLSMSQGSDSTFGELELTSDDMGALSFRSQADGMTMIWLYDRSDSQVAKQTASDNVKSE